MRHSNNLRESQRLLGAHNLTMCKSFNTQNPVSVSPFRAMLPSSTATSLLRYTSTHLSTDDTKPPRTKKTQNKPEPKQTKLVTTSATRYLISTTSRADKVKASTKTTSTTTAPELKIDQVYPQRHNHEGARTKRREGGATQQPTDSATARKLDLDSSSRTPSRRQPLSSTTDDSDEATTT